MRVSKIQLSSQYKRFHDLTIDLGTNPKKIIALVGPNGSGKSSVFDGMLFVANMFSTIGSFDRKDGKFHSMIGAAIDYKAITISFDNGLSFHQERKARKLEGRENTILSFRNSYRFNSNLDIKLQEALPDIKTNKSGASTSVDLDDNMTQNYQRIVVYLNHYRKDNDLTDKQAIEAILGELNKVFEACLNITLVDRGDIMSSRGMLFFKKKNQPNEFSFNVLSRGEKEVVDLMLDIYLKRKEFSEMIYIIDQPEIHLNTSIQKKVLIEIAKLIPDTCQIWIATHSIGFLNALKNELKDISDVIDF